MTKLRKVNASEKDFMDLKKEYSLIHESFRDFAQFLTDEAGKSTKKSNKADSYANTLIKLVILYKENFSDSISAEELDTFKGLAKLEKVTRIEGFKMFNTSGSHFMSATISCFRAYITSKNDKTEAKMDSQLNDKLLNIPIKDQRSLSNQKDAKPKNRPAKQIVGNKMTYPRSISEAFLAKQHSNWSCEIDRSHTTFTSSIEGKNFVEAHHLIPMAAQDNFDNSLDFADNIVTLCPNCHRMIHHSDSKTKRAAVNKLFDKRKHLFASYGIIIDKKTLQNYYGII